MNTEDKIEKYKNRIDYVNKEIFYFKEMIEVKEYAIKFLMTKIKELEEEKGGCK